MDWTFFLQVNDYDHLAIWIPPAIGVKMKLERCKITNLNVIYTSLSKNNTYP